MRGVYVANFGVKEGVQSFRVNGAFEDLQLILDECVKNNAIFEDYPEIERLRNNLCTMLLKIKVPIGVNNIERDT